MVVDMLAQTEKTQECRYFNYPNHSCHVETVVLLSKGVVDKDNYRKVKESRFLFREYGFD